jgi:alpha-tubulin suppressor-like RCC1 family protein
VAIKTDGSIWSWGYNDDGQHGVNDGFVRRSSPVQIGALTDWSLISPGNYTPMAIKTNGTLWGWGLNTSGQIGQGTTTTRSSPVQVGALTDWATAQAGTSSCIAIKTNGTLWTWGAGQGGKLMQNDVADRNSPVQVGTSTKWASAMTGFEYSMATTAEPF